MSNVNTMADVQTGQEVVLPERGLSELTEPKFTATQIENDCPARLQQIGREIAERLKKAEKQAKLAADHVIAVDKRLAEAKALCDGGGFHALQKKFFPNLGKSRVYELLAIGTNKKSVEEIKADTRARVAKHRANKATALVSVTVTEKSGPQPGARGGPKEDGRLEDTSVTSEQAPNPSKPRSAAAPGDEAERAFTVRVMELYRTTAKRPPERFSSSTAPVEVFAWLGNLFTDIANIKKSDAAKLELITALPENGTASAEQSAGGTEDQLRTRDAELGDDLDASVAALLKR